MADLNFVGDLAEINEKQLSYIKSVIEKQGYNYGKVIVEPVGKAGDNYIANVKRITVEDGKSGPFKIVAKIAPTHEMVRKMTNTKHLFRNEHIMYTRVLPKLTQLEISAEIPPKERLRYAACYGSSNDAPNEVILLEDLKESNFIMVDRMKPISADCVKSVLKNFALLHSSSFAFKYKEPELFEEYKNSLYDTWAVMDKQPEMIMFAKQVEDNAIKLVESDVHKKTIQGAMERTSKDFHKMAEYTKHSKHIVIQQGDAWTNNIMFKFDGETLLESIMIDYQGSKANNPVSDILYMIFNCTNYQMRKDHFHEWIDYYHTELDKSLHNYGLKASFVFPKDQLDVDLKRFGKISFGLSLLLAGALSMKTEEASKMKEMMTEQDPMKSFQDNNINDTISAETTVILKSRIEGLVDSYKELGLI